MPYKCMHLHTLPNTLDYIKGTCSWHHCILMHNNWGEPKRAARKSSLRDNLCTMLFEDLAKSFKKRMSKFDPVRLACAWGMLVTQYSHWLMWRQFFNDALKPRYLSDYVAIRHPRVHPMCTCMHMCMYAHVHNNPYA